MSNMSVRVGVTGVLPKTAVLSEVAAQIKESWGLDFAVGTGAGQFDLAITGSGTIAASGSKTFDLRGSELTPLGTAAVMVKVCAILVRAHEGNTNNVVLGNDTNHVLIFGAATHSVALLPGAVAALTYPGAGVTTVASTGDIIKLTNSGGGTSVGYDIIILGRSA